MSCSWPRVMSPVPGRSILITSAPNHARSCVQVGPDWTCVKSRILTPSSALPSLPHGLVETLGRPLPFAFLATTLSAGRLAALAFLAALSLRFAFLSFFFAIFVSDCLNAVGAAGDLLLAQLALRVEVADAAALAAGRRIDDSVDEGRLARVERIVDRAPELVGRGGIDADTAEGFRHLVVAGAIHERRGRRIRAAGGVDVDAAIDAVVVEDHDADRQLVAADRLDLHAAEAEGAVAFDGEHLTAGLHRGGDGRAHADAHDAPGADVEPLARLVHVDRAAGEVERVGPFVDEDRVRPLLDDGAQ